MVPLIAGTRMGRYEIGAPLGRGGMGAVYCATDTTLQRKVAIKILTRLDESSSARLLKEARAASALSHPNICTIYEVGQAGDQPFIAMEHVDGQTLRALIAAERFPVEKAVRFAIQIADALAHAHERGIVHCDLKDSNVVVGPDGRAKVLDFGLAIHQEPQASNDQGSPADISNDTTRSLAGVAGVAEVAGTLPYMAPELLKGVPSDPLSDLWAFGVLLYAMLSGELPFRGQTTFELIAAILQQLPIELPARVPASLRLIVGRCLAKERSSRYQRASEVVAALEAVGSDAKWTPPGARGSRTRRAAKSLAVMPLANASGATDAEYLSDGITETIINSLAALPNVRIVPRSTVFRYKGHDVDPWTIGRELDVRSVLTGRVEQRGDTLIIAVELVDTATQSQIWGDRYQRKLAEIFATQEEIAHQILEILRVKLTAPDRTRIARRHTHSVEAYQLYLRGRYFWNKRTPGWLEKCVGYFQQAIDRDPSYALPYTGLADAYNILGGYGLRRATEVFPLAKAAAAKALEIDDSLAETHSSLGWIHFYYDWDWEQGERAFTRAIARNPHYVFAHLWYAICLGWLGRCDEAVDRARRALRLEPLHVTANAIVGLVLYHARRYPEAIEQLLNTLELDAGYYPAHWWLGRVYAQTGNVAGAIRESQQAVDLSAGAPSMLAALGAAYATAGDSDRALAIAAQMDEISQTTYVAATLMAGIHALLQRPDTAFAYLERAYREHAVEMIYLKVDPRFDALRGDARFQELLRRVGLD